MATISGSHGSDKITGTSKSDVLKGNGGNDVINGGEGNDTIQGGTGNDKLYGNNGWDLLNGGLGYDKLYGGAGNDTFTFSTISDYTSGGNGNDVFIYHSYLGYSETDFYDNAQINNIKKYGIESYGNSGDDLWKNIKGGSLLFSGALGLGKVKINCGSGDDVFHFEGDSPKVLKTTGKVIDGGNGYDIIQHSGNNPNWGLDSQTINYSLFGIDENLYSADEDIINWNDFLNHSKNFEQLNLDLDNGFNLNLEDDVVDNNNSFKFFITSKQTETSLNIDASNETAASLIFNVYEYKTFSTYGFADLNYFGDLINAPYGKKTIFDIDIKGGAGDDQLNSSGEGDDLFQGNGGNDYFFGADGNNIAVFNGKKNQYLITEIGYNKFKVKDKVKGRDGIDTIENVNTLRFSDGDYDLVIKGLKIEGDGSAEVINGGNYSDYIDGGGGNDKLRGRKGNDQLIGGEGNDRLYGEAGNDKLIGGSGKDTAVFSSKSNVVKLFTTKKQNTKDGLDTLIGIENISAGSGNDKVYGSKASNILNGGKGSDLLSGGSGNDQLIGGIGNDKLIGGKGKDIFKLSKGKGFDLIQDFKNKQDKIFIGSIKKLKLKNKGKDVFIYQGKDLLAKVIKAKGLLSKKGKYLV